MQLRLGDRRYDLTTKALVMGILNRTPDSFYDKGEFYAMDQFLSRAESHAQAGADILDVGGVKAGPGPDVSEQEELDRVIPAVVALCQRFDLPVSVDTWRASVASAAFQAGAVLGNDISGFADVDYLTAASEAGASVVATHIRLGPRIPDPQPEYPQGLLKAVCDFLVDRAQRAEAAGLTPDRIVIDAGLDLGKTWAHSVSLLRHSATLASLGYPLLLSASNKTFLGKLLGLEIDQRELASMAATALGVSRGCRIVRVHDVRAARRVVDTLSSIFEAA